MKRDFLGILLLCGLLASLYSCNSSGPSDERPLTAIIDSLGLDADRVVLHVDKSEYRLSVMIDNQVVKSYPIVLGFNPVDDKMREGDGCTPEGTFELIDLYPHKKWSKFMWLGYPNEESHRKFKANKAAGRISETDAIGGEVGIHGVPEGMDYLIDVGKNWTLGCVSLKNSDINEVYQVSKVGTQVVIVL